ncbi:hypothetical protein [Hippea jasoniae]|uniref:hypothetical protein n=1 Tax=Hippea jasoniae TaxID=944479 RepID=UPI000555B3A7|nr:hypothetical protein [Hippea jasoniae]
MKTKKLHPRMNRFLFLKDFFKDVKNRNSIVTLGSIDYLFDDINQHENFLKILNIEDFDLNKYFENGRYSSKWFWEYLGFKEIDFIDTDGYFGAKDFDLNYDLKEEYGFSNQYDIVLNLGTTEHIFNQYNVFKNIHIYVKRMVTLFFQPLCRDN